LDWLYRASGSDTLARVTTRKPLRAKLATSVSKGAAALSRATGRGDGSVIGGRLGLMIDPELLSHLATGREIALISGTNGKTTTTRLTTAALGVLGPVATNSYGANMPTGHTSALAKAGDTPYAVLETDEHYLPQVLAATHPRVVALLNLSRDQLDRAKEVAMMAQLWRDTLRGQPLHLVANADDPMVVWATGGSDRVTWVAAGQRWHDDSWVCPECGGAIARADQTVAESGPAAAASTAPGGATTAAGGPTPAGAAPTGAVAADLATLGADPANAAPGRGGVDRPAGGTAVATQPPPEPTIETVSVQPVAVETPGQQATGSADAPDADWHCTNCALRRPTPQWSVDGTAVVDPLGGRHEVRLQLPGRVNRANAATALAVAAQFGVAPAEAAPRLAEVASIAGRYAQVERDGRTVRLLLAKNPAGWLEAFDMAEPAPTLLSINARDPDGMDTSWLFDVDFSPLAGRPVLISGDRAFDLAVRLEVNEVHFTHVRSFAQALTSVPPGRLEVIANYSAFQDIRAELDRVN
jgi:UDP-N-acetylmuramyl tripeptide synthase